MNTLIIIQAFIAFAVGVASLYSIYYLLNTYLKRRFGIEEVNAAYATFQAGIILATANLLSSVVLPGMNAIRFITQETINLQTIGLSVLYLVAFELIGLLAALLVISTSLTIFFRLTTINEIEEIKKNNVAIPIIIAAIIIGLSIFLKDYIGHVCESLIPYPKVLQLNG